MFVFGITLSALGSEAFRHVFVAFFGTAVMLVGVIPKLQAQVKSVYFLNHCNCVQFRSFEAGLREKTADNFNLMSKSHFVNSIMIKYYQLQRDDAMMIKIFHNAKF